MAESEVANVADGIAYKEREAVAVFDNESSLNAAVDALMLAGLRQDDFGVLADAGSLSAQAASNLADKESTPRTEYVSPDSRTEGLAALAGGRDAHFHVVHRTWGLADRPMHDVNPDPFLRG
jgi:hypothetical protein